MNIGGNIRKYRKDKNVSRKELANEIGCSVYAIENTNKVSELQT